MSTPAVPKLCQCERPKTQTDDQGVTFCIDCGHELKAGAPRKVLAELVAGVLDERSQVAQAPLVDATTLARVLGVTRKTVYRRKHEFGVVSLGDGPRPRLRFDLERARQALR